MVDGDGNVKNQVRLGKIHRHGGVVDILLNLVDLLGGHLRDDFQFLVRPAGHDAGGAGCLQAPHAAGVGHHDALDVFDDVAADLNGHPVRHLAQRLAGNGGGIGHGNGLGAAHGGQKLIFQNLHIGAIDKRL